MKQLDFEGQHSVFWGELALTLDSLVEADSAPVLDPRADRDADVIARFPSDYRKLCQHLAMAKSRRYSAGLVNRLNELVQRGYGVLYGQQIRNHGLLLEFFRYGFPAALRSNSAYLWVSAAAFLLPFIGMLVACIFNDQIIYSVMDAGSVRGMESMYEPDADKFGRERQADSDIMMFGFYIYNNIGIAFKCFALGLFAGVGSLFMLAYNGLVIGGVSGHLTALNYTETFYPFVVGHGSFELTAIVFSGAAGLKIGFALLSPGAYSRRKALQVAAADAVKIMYGVFVMLLIAAFIEAFWSSSSLLPVWVKFTVGAFLWFIVYYYCFFSAREKVANYINQHATR